MHTDTHTYTRTKHAPQRAEHNAGALASLQELCLPQARLSRVDLLGRACRSLRILYLQGNVLGCLDGLGRLKVCVYVCVCVCMLGLLWLNIGAHAWFIVRVSVCCVGKGRCKVHD